MLDLDAFERNTKAEGLGVGPDGPAGEKNMYDADFTTLLFRFLQLTSEGHNNGKIYVRKNEIERNLSLMEISVVCVTRLAELPA